jgi:hypothetical protein
MRDRSDAIKGGRGKDRSFRDFGEFSNRQAQLGIVASLGCNRADADEHGDFAVSRK